MYVYENRYMHVEDLIITYKCVPQKSITNQNLKSPKTICERRKKNMHMYTYVLLTTILL
jgi:hypothetical protein